MALPTRTWIDKDELIERCDLRDIIVPHLEKARSVSGGEYFVGCCPFHEDRKPSFLVYKERYECLSASCGAWGSVIDWYWHSNPGLSFGDLLILIDGDCGFPKTVILPLRKKKIEIPKEEPLPEFWSKSKADEFAIVANKGWVRHRIALDWVQNKWLLDRETIYRERIGYDDNQQAIVIPVWHDYYTLITLRYRNHGNPNMGKYWGIERRNGVYGYGRMWLKGAKNAIIVFGEMTALFLKQWGFASFSWTNGCLAFKPYLKKVIFDSGVQGGVIVPDIGECDQAFRVAKTLGADNWKVAFLDTVWDAESGDVIDWVKDGGGTKEKFCDLLMNRAIPANEVRTYFADRHGNDLWKR